MEATTRQHDSQLYRMTDKHILKATDGLVEAANTATPHQHHTTRHDGREGSPLAHTVEHGTGRERARESESLLVRGSVCWMRSDLDLELYIENVIAIVVVVVAFAWVRNFSKACESDGVVEENHRQSTPLHLLAYKRIRHYWYATTTIGESVSFCFYIALALRLSRNGATP